MFKKGKKKRYYLFLLWLGGLLFSAQLQAQDLHLLLEDSRDCNQNTYCLSIQLQAESTPSTIGTSSIFLQYDPAAVAYASYTSSHFDGSDQCIQGKASSWDVQTFDATSAAGFFNLTMTLLTNQFSCPAIEGKPIEVGVLCFNVIDENKSPAIKVLENNTSFNSSDPNNGQHLHPISKMGYMSSPKSLSCTESAIDCGQLEELWKDTSIEIPIASCDELTSFCTGISFNNKGAYELLLNDELTEAKDNCEDDNTTRFYTYSSLLKLDQEGTFEVVNWEVNGKNHSGNFSTAAALSRQLNEWDAGGDWQIDPKFNAITGGKSDRQYGFLEIKNTSTGLDLLMALNKKVESHTTAIALPEGVHHLTATNKYTKCKDKLTVIVTCSNEAEVRDEVKRDFSIRISKDTSICLTDLITANDFIEDCSEQLEATSEVAVDPATNCLTLSANAVGMNNHCLYICDEEDNCSTLQLIVEVVSSSSSTLRDDQVSVMMNEAKQFDVTRNDVINGVVDQFEVPYSRTSGSIEVDEFSQQIKYTPDYNVCGIQDSFQYKVVTEVGESRATVYVEVLCEELTIFSGFSPNGDGINDAFKIMGIENFEENELVIFNSRGNEVYSKSGYQNEDGWDGTWKGKDLPDGTYYYMLYIGTQSPRSGYVQLRR